MSAARKQFDADDRSRFEDAVDSLPHVRVLPDGQWETPRCWWWVPVTVDVPDDLGAAYGWECAIGRELGLNFVETVRRHPEHARSIAGSTLKDMIRRGRLSGIEIAFVEQLVEHLNVRPGLTVIKARVPQPDGSVGLYSVE